VLIARIPLSAIGAAICAVVRRIPEGWVATRAAGVPLHGSPTILPARIAGPAARHPNSREVGAARGAPARCCNLLARA
jgi:hypothetical protein